MRQARTLVRYAATDLTLRLPSRRGKGAIPGRLLQTDGASPSPMASPTLHDCSIVGAKDSPLPDAAPSPAIGAEGSPLPGAREGAGVRSVASSGRRTVKVLPTPASLCASTVPPWRCTISCTLASPMPVPFMRCVRLRPRKKRSKTCGRSASVMPIPWSCTLQHGLAGAVRAPRSGAPRRPRG